MKWTAATIGLIVTFAASGVMAHGGGLDANGCHHDRKRGGYHCHRSAQRPTAPIRQRTRTPQPTTLYELPAPAPANSGTKQLVAKVQQALADLGYYDGPITGSVGNLTKKAIADFEGVFGLKVSGRITPELLRLLRVD